jgi:hypothetical protein
VKERSGNRNAYALASEDVEAPKTVVSLRDLRDLRLKVLSSIRASKISLSLYLRR